MPQGPEETWGSFGFSSEKQDVQLAGHLWPGNKGLLRPFPSRSNRTNWEDFPSCHLALLKSKAKRIISLRLSSMDVSLPLIGNGTFNASY